MTGHIHEECGVFGIFAPQTQDVASTAYYALFALQHRGQESAGIVVNRDGVFNSYKDSGLVNDVFIGLAAMLYVWVLYPLICEGFSLLRPPVANIMLVVIVVGFAAACTGSYLELALWER